METAPHPCPYLPGRCSVSRGFLCAELPGWAYQQLMDAGFRRSGRVFYQNVCPGCRACTAIRVPVSTFRESRNQRRIRRRNADLRTTLGEPALTDEKHELYARYLAGRHNGSMASDRESLDEFLCRPATSTLEVQCRDATGRLLGVGICDVTPEALSSVYFYFAPEERRRGLGVFSSLVEIDLARSLGLAWYYPGFWVPGCSKMAYKSALRPCELLGTDGRWRPFGEGVEWVLGGEDSPEEHGDP